MRIVDEKTLDLFRGVRTCELCGKSRPCDAHHAVSTRGAGRLDISANLMSICRPCHSAVDSRAGSERCKQIVAAREGCTVADIEAVINMFRLLPKGRTKEQIEAMNWQDIGLEDNGDQYRLAFAVLDAMPDQSPKPSPVVKKKRRKSALRERAKAARKQGRENAKKWRKEHAK